MGELRRELNRRARPTAPTSLAIVVLLRLDCIALDRTSYCNTDACTRLFDQVLPRCRTTIQIGNRSQKMLEDGMSGEIVQRA